MKKYLGAALCLVLLLGVCPAQAVVGQPGELKAASVILMEKETGQILYEKNAHARLEPASVTKVMTMLLVMEAIDAGTLTWEQPISVSAHAVSMGGSQIWRWRWSPPTTAPWPWRRPWPAVRTPLWPG